eukprot:204064_1
MHFFARPFIITMDLDCKDLFVTFTTICLFESGRSVLHMLPWRVFAIFIGFFSPHSDNSASNVVSSLCLLDMVVLSDNLQGVRVKIYLKKIRQIRAVKCDAVTNIW